MAKTVNEAFAEFHKNKVNLDPDRTKLARKSREWLRGQLDSLPQKISDFPKLFPARHLDYGSFAKRIKIQPIDDIDLFFAFAGEGGHYSVSGDSVYKIHVHNSAAKLLLLCDDDGTLNSKKVINKLIKGLEKIDQYKKAEMKRNMEAATLKLSSYEWNFDIVPVFYTVNDFYLIPDGYGGWKQADPRVDDQRLLEVNEQHNKMANQLIRTLKFWNKRINATTVPSYLFENIIINYLKNESTVYAYIDNYLLGFWNYLTSAIFNVVNDPKGFQGNLNPLTYAEKESLSQKASEAYQKANEALNSEVDEKDHQKAISKWREIFGSDNFPKYE